MRTELDSGAWVDLRPADQMVAGDRVAYDNGIRLGIDADTNAAQIQISIGMMTEQKMRLFMALCSEWSYPWPMESDDPADPLASIRAVPIDDWQAIEELLEPHLTRLRTSGPKDRTPLPAPKGTTGRSKHSSKGNPRVIPVTLSPEHSSASGT